MKAARYSWIVLLAVTAARAGDSPSPQGDTPPPPPKEEGAPDKQPGGPKGPRGEGRGGEGRGEGMRRMMEAWKKADTNGDTFISPEEFAAMERIAQLTPEKRDELFKRFDKNSDGKIGQDELRPPRPNPTPNPNPDGGEGPPRRKRLPELDLNKDGKIDFDEFKTDPFVNRLPEESQQNMFKRFDTDGDGFLTPQDRPQRDGRGGGGGRGRGGLLELIKDHDKDGNGSLNFEEFRQIPWIAKDGEDEQERRFEEFDKNKDLKLDAADAPPPGEKPDRPERPDKPKDGKKPGEGN